MLRLVLGCLIAVLFSAVGVAQPVFHDDSAEMPGSRALDYREYLHWASGTDLPQATSGFAAFGAYMYSATAQGIMVHKLVSGTPSFVGMGSSSLGCRRVDVAGDLLVADSHGEGNSTSNLHIYDLNDPANPDLITKIALPDGLVVALATDGRYAYVGIRFQGVFIYDIRSTSGCRLQGFLDPDHFSSGFFFLRNNLLVVGDYPWMYLVDVSQSASPEILSTINGNFSAVDQAGDLLYFTGHGDRLSIWNISDPRVPFEVGSIDLPSSGLGIRVRDEIAYIASNGLYTVDVSNPAQPARMGRARVRQGGEFIELIEDQAVVVGRPISYSSRMDVFEVTNPYTVPLSGQWAPYLANGYSIAVEIKLGYISHLGQDRISIVSLVDATDPVELAEISSFENPREMVAGPDWLAVSGQTPEVQIYNTRTPDIPYLMATIPLPDGSNDLAFAEGILAVAPYFLGITLIDLTDVTQPEILVELPGLGYCRELKFVDRTLYASREGEIIAIDCTNPQEPIVRSIGLAPSTWVYLDVAGDRVYCSTFSLDVYYGTVSVFDATVMDGPVPPLAEYQVPGSGPLAIAEDILYMASFGALWVADISDGFQPVGNGPVMSSMDDILIHGSYVFGAAGGAGLIVHDRYGGAGMPFEVESKHQQKPDSTKVSSLRTFPNPFNPQTTISFFNDKPQHVRVEVYDIQGRRIAILTDQQYQPGEHSVEWQGRDSSGRSVPSGEYFFRVDIGGQVETRKAMLLR